MLSQWNNIKCVCRSNIDDYIKTQTNEKMNEANGKRKQPASNKIEIGLKYRIKCLAMLDYYYIQL